MAGVNKVMTNGDPVTNISVAASEPISDFTITIKLNLITQSEAVRIALTLKEQFGDSVSLRQQVKKMYLTKKG
ncbi:Uncharacterised protein [Pasteurella multocida]|nr:Uncharacterised protein [Pasteurella multocida]